MKIQLLSDLHIEHIGYFSIPKIDSDIIILAGDIDIGMEGLFWAEELRRLHKKPVIYIAGNHEYYKNDLHELTDSMRRFADAYDNLHFLEKNEIQIDGVRILGTTLWTNYFDEYGPAERDKNIALLDEVLNDHSLISIKGKRFTARDAYVEHQNSVAWLSSTLKQRFNGKTVVVTHHAPSFRCNHLDFGMNPYSPGFVSNLDHLFEKADIWCFGHTHSNLDTKIANCRLVSNQKGYRHEKIPVAYKPNLIIEL
jgi:predicted phosphodiesterase